MVKKIKIAMQRWVSMVNECSLCDFLLYEYICGCFVNGLGIHGLAVIEALRRPTGIYWNYCVKHAM